MVLLVNRVACHLFMSRTPVDSSNSGWTLNCLISWEEICMSFGIYLIGYLILILGLAIGAHLMNMPPRWIGVGVLVMIGIGVISGVSSTRNRDSSL